MVREGGEVWSDSQMVEVVFDTSITVERNGVFGVKEDYLNLRLCYRFSFPSPPKTSPAHPLGRVRRSADPGKCTGGSLDTFFEVL